MNAPEATALLIERLNDFTENNRNFALDELLRSPERVKALSKALSDGKIDSTKLGGKRLDLLKIKMNEPAQ